MSVRSMFYTMIACSALLTMPIANAESTMSNIEAESNWKDSTKLFVIDMGIQTLDLFLEMLAEKLTATVPYEKEDNEPIEVSLLELHEDEKTLNSVWQVGKQIRVRREAKNNVIELMKKRA